MNRFIGSNRPYLLLTASLGAIQAHWMRYLYAQFDRERFVMALGRNSNQMFVFAADGIYFFEVGLNIHPRRWLRI